MTKKNDLFAGGGEMGALMRSTDWSKTKIGPPENWPQSLKTMLGVLLGSRFPMMIWWGPNLFNFYNDAYRPILRDKHPASLAAPAAELWAEIWDFAGPLAHGVLSGGPATWMEDVQLFINSGTMAEETYFTFSYSPIPGDDGKVGGLLNTVQETTVKVQSERQIRMLHDLAARAADAKSEAEACRIAIEVLSANELDIPFTLLYALNEGGKAARLIGSGSLKDYEGPAKPAEAPIDDRAGAKSWPLAQAARTSREVLVEDLAQRFGPLPPGRSNARPERAIVLPLFYAGHAKPFAFLAAGISPHRAFDDRYRRFFRAAADQVMTVVANARAYEEERKRAEALAEIDRAKTAFFSNVSHEFRTPLTLMLGPIEEELAERESPLPPARRERLETAHRNSLRLLKLVNSLLDFSRIEAGRVQANFEPVDLAVFTRELSEMFRSAIEKAGLTLTVDCPTLPEPVFIDREMWEKIVFNLLSNAFKHTFKGSLTVTLKRRQDRVELSVKDTGVGMSPAERAHLFERFYRVKGAQSRTHEGTGIGLALIKELAALHGGTVDVESEEGKGSVFTVAVKTGREHLPAAQIKKESSAASAAVRPQAYVEEALRWSPMETPAAGKAAAKTSAGSRPRILLADDNADMRDYVRGLLAAYYEVQAVEDGSAALSATRKNLPDLVVSDVMMPRLDGFGLLKELRADETTRSVPVILLSARAGEEAAIEGLNVGADDYVAKPFSARELLARVNTHLELARVRHAWSKELARVNKELEAFSYSVSHDLRAPLRAIDGFSKILLKDHSEKLDAEARHLLHTVIQSVHGMGVLINDLLEFARLGRAELKASFFDPTSMAQGVIGELVRTCPGRKIDVAVEPLPAAWGDLALLKQVFVNLISNAVKYTRSRDLARIEIGGRAGEQENTYWIKDNGVGFDMQYAHKLFGVFQRLHSSDDFEGTGVGLALVQRIVQRHDGRVWAEATVNQGASFYFTLANPANPRASG